MTVADIRFDWNPSMDAVPESLRGYPAEMGEKGGRGYTLSAMSGCVREMVRRLASQRGTPRLGYVTMRLKEPGSGADRVFFFERFTELELPWDPLPMFDVDDLGRKEMALDIIRAGMGELAARTGADVAHVLRACEEVRRAGYENRWVWRRKQGPSKMAAEAVVEHDSESVAVSLVVYGRQGQMMRDVPVARIPAVPHTWPFYDDYLGELFWEGEVAVLEGRSGVRVEVDMETGEVRRSGEPQFYPPALTLLGQRDADFPGRGPAAR